MGREDQLAVTGLGGQSARLRDPRRRRPRVSAPATVRARDARDVLAELRDGHLLLIDCRLPDWAGRSLLRLMNNEPRQSKATLEFMADSAGDPRVNAFISRFSPSSLLVPRPCQRLRHRTQPPLAGGPRRWRHRRYAPRRRGEAGGQRRRSAGLRPLRQRKHCPGACDYFLPLLSDEVDARREGVFWEE